ncbi:hypothetical protein RDp07_gp29 [Roseobacter phage RD-1410Ws-07]|uniref:Uncharacterized protein n=2 Tax=Sanyabayvirus DS1410Ws06 TaxID=2844087 RepID=A0A191VYQ1_9CAUD|nr:hypothetical protein HYO98_gp32 [Dinoroseobacter phage DS-1410Ws-06]ANJ20689.1 hypothetical protein DSp06_gp32 [Dinoroseobacter phage DS-1410Ws-06]ANJ20840.1 hypothetical protein RDp07_gp29 [Roseobacter phage RD-1410Ws-07]
MAILFVGNTAGEVGMGIDDAAATTRYDTTYVNNCIEMQNNEGGALPIPQGRSELWIHFDLACDTGANNINSDGDVFTINTDGNRAWQMNLSNGNWGLEASTNGSSFAANGVVAIGHPADQIVTSMDIHIALNSGGNDFCRFYTNGNLAMEQSAAHVAGSDNIMSFVFSHFDAGARHYYSQVIIADESTLGMKLTPLTPESNTADNAWVGDFSALVDRNDGLAAFSDTAGQLQGFNLTDYIGPASPTGLRGVFMASRAGTGDSGPTGFNHYLEIGGTKYHGANIANPTPDVTQVTEWATNPATASAWDSTALNALIAGIRSNA